MLQSSLSMLLASADDLVTAEMPAGLLYNLPVVTVSPQNAVSRANLGINMRIGEDHDDERYVGPQDLHDVVDLPVQDNAAPQVRVVPEATEDFIKLCDGAEKKTRRDDPRENDVNVRRNVQAGNIKIIGSTRLLSLLDLLPCLMSGINLNTLVAFRAMAARANLSP